MEIGVKMDGVTGNFDTSTGTLTCVHYQKYDDVILCFKEKANIPFAQIKLFDSGLLKDAKSTYEDACKLGDEIARRWNSNPISATDVEKMVLEAMEYHWNDFVGDTHSLPDDFELSNNRTKMSFTPGQWAGMVAEAVAKKICNQEG